jgi:hypothetical protein
MKHLQNVVSFSFPVGYVYDLLDLSRPAANEVAGVPLLAKPAVAPERMISVRSFQS